MICLIRVSELASWIESTLTTFVYSVLRMSFLSSALNLNEPGTGLRSAQCPQSNNETVRTCAISSVCIYHTFVGEISEIHSREHVVLASLGYENKVGERFLQSLVLHHRLEGHSETFTRCHSFLIQELVINLDNLRKQRFEERRTLLSSQVTIS